MGTPEARPWQGLRAGTPLKPLNRQFLQCPVHPEDPLQFFCLECETEVCCAECVLHGPHRGHSVLNIRESAARLQDKVSAMAGQLQTQIDEISAEAQRIQRDRRDLAEAAAKGRSDLRAAFAQLRAALAEKEKALLVEVDQCAQEVEGILKTRAEDEGNFQEAIEGVQRAGRGGDAVESLNWYARLRQLIAEVPSPPPSSEAESVFLELKEQLQRGFDVRLKSGAAVHGRIARITSAPSMEETLGSQRDSRPPTPPRRPSQGQAPAPQRV